MRRATPPLTGHYTNWSYDLRRALLASILLHEDKKVLAFNKPSGLASQAGGGVRENLEDALVVYADAKRRRPHLAHRLDRETSGVLIAGRTPQAIAFLNAQFAERSAEKTYLAVTCAVPPQLEGAIDIALVKTKAGKADLMRPAREGEAGGLQARTLYRTLATAEGAAFLALTPQTGRMHQLRVHLSAIGCPIAGDMKYGGLSVVGPKRTAIARLMLHAARLKIAHPDGGVVNLTAAPDAAFLSVLSALDLSSGLDLA
jgi:tRNA pseudouridine32 synthase/23S rRNA pseudouridine746 synthase